MYKWVPVNLMLATTQRSSIPFRVDKVWNRGEILLFTETSNNKRPFASYLLPLCQNKSLCETTQIKMSLICMKMEVQVKLIFKWLHTDTHFDTKTKGNAGLFWLLLLDAVSWVSLNKQTECNILPHVFYFCIGMISSRWLFNNSYITSF